MTQLRRDGLTPEQVANRLGLAKTTVRNIDLLASRKLTEAARTTEREREVGRLLALNLSTADIATKLGIARNTVMEHRRQLMNVLGLHSVVELTHYAIVEGWVEPGEALHPTDRPVQD